MDNLITKIISGNQTGLDRAALNVGIELGTPQGGCEIWGRWSVFR